MIDPTTISLAIGLGTAIGIFTGIIPGIHVNTVAALLLTATASVTAMGFDTMAMVAFISALAISHTFFNIIPGLFIGVPGDAVFAQLPGHRLVKSGYGKLAIRLSTAGSGFGLLIGVLLSGGLLFVSEFADWKPLEDKRTMARKKTRRITTRSRNDSEIRSVLGLITRLHGDVKAVQRGTIGMRIARRIVGKDFEQLLRRVIG